MQRRSLSKLVVYALLACLVLGACQNAIENRAAQVGTTSAPAKEITVVDALGRTIRFSQLPQRIAIAGKGAMTVADAVYMFPEAQERVVALVRARQNVTGFLTFVDPVFDRKTLLEVEAGPEQIASVRPDVVVLKSYMAAKLGKGLEKIGIQVVYVDLETPEQYFKDIQTLGQLLGNQARAEEVQGFFQSRLDRVSQALEGLDETQKPLVLILQYSEQGGDAAFFVPSAEWIQTILTELAAGIPVWKEAAQGGGWTVVNFEQIAVWDPDKIFVVDYRSDSSQVTAKLKADPQWQALKAVQQGELYGFAGDVFSWDQPDPRWALGLTWLAGRIHPDLYTGVDIREEICDFFSQLFGMPDTSITAHIASQLRGDVE